MSATLRAVLDKQMSEEQLLQAVRRLAHLWGWLTYHTRDSRRSDPGFVDLVLVRPPRLLFVELKRQDGKLRPDQVRWLLLLKACTEQIEVYTWKPSDWNEIERVLA